VQILRRGDHVEVTGEIGQRLNLSSDVQPSAQPIRDPRGVIHLAIDAEDLMAEVLQHLGESTCS
jgi:hypothetical protein